MTRDQRTSGRPVRRVRHTCGAWHRLPSMLRVRYRWCGYPPILLKPALRLRALLGLGHDGGSCLGTERMAGDLLVAREALLQLLYDAVLRDGDHRRRTRLEAVANRLEVLVLEALVADLAPDAATGTAYGQAGEDRRREDQPDHSTRDRAAFGP